MWLAREREEPEMMPGFGVHGIGITVLPWREKIIWSFGGSGFQFGVYRSKGTS